jgi:hypothetical protein
VESEECRVSLEVTGDEALVKGLPSGVELRCEPNLLQGSFPA